MPKRLTQVEKDQRKRASFDRKAREALHATFDEINEENTERLKHIDPDTWNKAVEESLQTETDDKPQPVFYVVNHDSWISFPFVHLEFIARNIIVLAGDMDCSADGHIVVNRRNWREQLENMTPVQKLVHLAKRYAIDEIATIKAMIQRLDRRAYEGELTIQASHVGCDRQGHLTNEFVLADIDLRARDASEDIANTYNYDLAIAIQKISQMNPRGNRFYYAKHLGIWEQQRDTWKVPQIQQHENGLARAQAQKDFYRRNRDILGTATLRPKKAVCPICIGWVKRGVVPIRVAVNNPPPYHVNCPHYWYTRPDRVAKSECASLWMGGD